MAQTIKLKRGLEANRNTITPLLGEIIYTTDNTEIFIGDGSTPGGLEVGYLNKRIGGTVANLTVTGNLTVNGTTTTVNSNDVTIGDATIFLNSDLEIDTAPSEDSGLIINRGSEADATLLWNETEDYWEIGNGISNQRILTTGDSFLNTINSDSGSYAASSFQDSITISGDSVISTNIVGQTLFIDHDFVPRNDTTSETTANPGTTFDVIDSVITSDEGHITAINVKTVTIPDGYSGETIVVSEGGTGATSFTLNGIVYGNGTDPLQSTNAGEWDLENNVGQILSVDSNGVPTWTNTIDGGTF